MPVTKFFKRFKSLLRPATHRDTPDAHGENFDRISPQREYSGSQNRLYRVHTPPGYRTNTPLPLAMVLHGCLQDHLDIQAISQFDVVANRHNFIAVYPFVTHYSDLRTRNCWGWWLKKHIIPGSGEVEDLWHIVEGVNAEFSVDPRRIHIAGLSSGGCMTVAALTVHANRFASGAAVAGLAYGESPGAVLTLPFSQQRRYKPIAETVTLMQKIRNNERTPTPLFIVHSHGDQSVQIQAAKNLRDSWLSYFSSDRKIIEREKHYSTLGTAWVHTRYGKWLGESVVETLFLDGLEHGWYGGAAGKFSYTSAPSISEMMWQFFNRHPLKSTRMTKLSR